MLKTMFWAQHKKNREKLTSIMTRWRRQPSNILQLVKNGNENYPEV